MGVVPESSSLILGLEIVQEGMAWSDGALRDTRGAIGPGTSSLEETVPVLYRNQHG